jgi:hypothetical protein
VLRLVGRFRRILAMRAGFWRRGWDYVGSFALEAAFPFASLLVLEDHVDGEYVEAGS